MLGSALSIVGSLLTAIGWFFLTTVAAIVLLAVGSFITHDVLKWDDTNEKKEE